MSYGADKLKMGVNFDFDLKFDLEGQSWLPPPPTQKNKQKKQTIGTLSKVFCIFGPNLVILAWTGDELSLGQTWWRTDGQGNDNARRPRVKTLKRY